MSSVASAVNSPQFLYRLRDAHGALLYVGVTVDWPSRMKQHQADKPWWGDVLAVELVRMDCSRRQLEAIEKAVIKTEAPTHNVVHNEARRTVTVPAIWEKPTNLNRFNIADEVWHPTFGKGVIIDVHGQGEHTEASIRFKCGTKHLSLAWAPLELMDERDIW